MKKRLAVFLKKVEPVIGKLLSISVFATIFWIWFAFINLSRGGSHGLFGVAGVFLLLTLFLGFIYKQFIK